ncbi:hypothetical protein HDU98_002970 [Podochytrium sp. JEL0797]|nr:hypothetical protein HDU98_002970 [Podochytrium sp. JEL0797]
MGARRAATEPFKPQYKRQATDSPDYEQDGSHDDGVSVSNANRDSRAKKGMSEKRIAQIRAAQRSYRARKDNHLKDLEAKIAHYEAGGHLDTVALAQKVAALESEHARLLQHNQQQLPGHPGGIHCTSCAFERVKTDTTRLRINELRLQIQQLEQPLFNTFNPNAFNLLGTPEPPFATFASPPDPLPAFQTNLPHSFLNASPVAGPSTSSSLTSSVLNGSPLANEMEYGVEGFDPMFFESPLFMNWINSIEIPPPPLTADGNLIQRAERKPLRRMSSMRPSATDVYGDPDVEFARRELKELASLKDFKDVDNMIDIYYVSLVFGFQLGGG